MPTNRVLYFSSATRTTCSWRCSKTPQRTSARREKALRLTEIDPPEAIRRLVAFTWEYYLERTPSS
jgi:hypothetical protein